MSQMTLKTPSTSQTGSSAGVAFGRDRRHYLPAIALFGWANSDTLTFDNWGTSAAGQRFC